MRTSTPPTPASAPIPVTTPLPTSVHRLLDLLAEGVSAARIGYDHGIRPARQRHLLQEAATALRCGTAQPGEVLRRATSLGVLPPPPGGCRHLSDDALVFAADLALGKTVHTIASERGLTEGDLDAHGKRVLAEVPARTYPHAVYLSTPTLITVPADRIAAARSRLAARTGQTVPAHAATAAETPDARSTA
ncbi:hypothetical protein ACIO3O_34580 [Streptomyces sp. NPDC087440]|uniref:hypothetical protein n=1 Tax=Streptomyces sp. NPDC087440 TaxID=3365790 RepID=UPI0038188A2D